MNDSFDRLFNSEELHPKILKFILVEKTLVKNKMEERDFLDNCEKRFPYLFEITFGNQQLIKEILETIIETMPIELQKIRSHFEDQSIKKVAETFHKIKPNLESLEFNQLYLTATKLESAAFSGDLKYLEANVISFLESVERELLSVKEDYLISR
jgi:HPt (histidine-containing phosphotransfer) domain-containing protein